MNVSTLPSSVSAHTVQSPSFELLYGDNSDYFPSWILVSEGGEDGKVLPQTDLLLYPKYPPIP